MKKIDEDRLRILNANHINYKERYLEIEKEFNKVIRQQTKSVQTLNEMEQQKSEGQDIINLDLNTGNAIL